MEQYQNQNEINSTRSEIERLITENMMLQRSAQESAAITLKNMCAVNRVVKQQSVMTDWAVHSIPMRIASKATKRSFDQYVADRDIDRTLWSHDNQACSYIYSQNKLCSAISEAACGEYSENSDCEKLIRDIVGNNLGKRVFVYDVNNADMLDNRELLLSDLNKLGFLCMGFNEHAKEAVTQKGPHDFLVGAYPLFTRLSNLAVLCGKQTVSISDVLLDAAADQHCTHTTLELLNRCGVRLPTKSDSEQPEISIIILSWNNTVYTQNCLISILENSGNENYEIIVVDNNSTDGASDILARYQALFDNFILIQNDENLGFPKGNNIGLKRARGKYLVLLNNDTYVTSDWLTGLRRHFEQCDDLGMIGPLADFSSNEQQRTICEMGTSIRDFESFAKMIRAVNNGKLLDVDMLQFFCTMIKRTAFEEVGYLDEAFGLGVCEDDDYSARMKAAGYRIACAQDVAIRHFHGKTFDLIDNETKEKNLRESIMQYAVKHGERPKYFKNYPL